MCALAVIIGCRLKRRAIISDLGAERILDVVYTMCRAKYLALEIDPGVYLL